MRYKLLLIACLFMYATTQAQVNAGHDLTFKWGQLAPIPNDFGFAGSFAGVAGNALIVAGGANFPDGGAPWTGSKKVWTDKIFVLEHPTGKWKLAGKLPQPMGYGVSVSYHNQLICIGGSNAVGHLSTVHAISYRDGKIIMADLPALPQALANSCGAVISHTLYIAGGLFGPDDKVAANAFWSLDLDKPVAWKKLDIWPGAPRMLAVAGALNGTFYLFSGTALEDKNGTAHRKYLTDAFAYTPGKGWKQLADMPAAVVAAAGPAYSPDDKQLLIFGGDDGQLADSAAGLKDKHPGFSDKVLSYHPRTNSWTEVGHIATIKKPDAAANPNGSLWAPVTTSSVIWNGELIIPGGEVRPAVRTPRVLTVSIKPKGAAKR